MKGRLYIESSTTITHMYPHASNVHCTVTNISAAPPFCDQGLEIEPDAAQSLKGETDCMDEVQKCET